MSTGAWPVVWLWGWCLTHNQWTPCTIFLEGTLEFTKFPVSYSTTNWKNLPLQNKVVGLYFPSFPYNKSVIDLPSMWLVDQWVDCSTDAERVQQVREVPHTLRVKLSCLLLRSRQRHSLEPQSPPVHRCDLLHLPHLQPRTNINYNNIDYKRNLLQKFVVNCLSVPKAWKRMARNVKINRTKDYVHCRNGFIKMGKMLLSCMKIYFSYDRSKITYLWHGF